MNVFVHVTFGNTYQNEIIEPKPNLLQFGILLISMTMFEVGILIFLQIKKDFMNDEFDQSLELALEMSESNIKYRETWDLLQITVSFIPFNQGGKANPICNRNKENILIKFRWNSLNAVEKIARTIGGQ